MFDNYSYCHWEEGTLPMNVHCITDRETGNEIEILRYNNAPSNKTEIAVRNWDGKPTDFGTLASQLYPDFMEEMKEYFGLTQKQRDKIVNRALEIAIKEDIIDEIKETI